MIIKYGKSARRERALPPPCPIMEARVIVREVAEGTCSCSARGPLHVVEINGERNLYCTDCTVRLIGVDQASMF